MRLSSREVFGFLSRVYSQKQAFLMINLSQSKTCEGRSRRTDLFWYHLSWFTWPSKLRRTNDLSSISNHQKNVWVCVPCTLAFIIFNLELHFSCWIPHPWLWSIYCVTCLSLISFRWINAIFSQQFCLSFVHHGLWPVEHSFVSQKPISQILLRPKY